MKRTPRIDSGGLKEAGGTAPHVVSMHPNRKAGHDPVAIELLEGEVEALVLRERTRWAYGIHDGLTQVITAAILELEWLAELIEGDPRGAIDALDSVKAEMRKALDELRGIMFNLSHGSTPDPGDPHEPLADYIRDVAKRWRLQASVSVEGDLGTATESVLEAASAVIGESVANVAKHSRSRDVAVRVVASPTQVTVEIEDRGCGFAVGPANADAGHFGLEVMRKRALYLGGTLEIRSTPGIGTRVVARLPVSSQGETT